MSTPTTSQDPPAANSIAGRHGLIRSKEQRQVAGVCAGIARATDTDPMLWRVLVTVGVLFGGVGVVAYLLGWLLMPEEEDTGSPLEALLGRGHSSTSGIVTVILGIATALLLMITVEWTPVTFLVVTLVGLVMHWQRKSDSPPSAAPPRATLSGHQGGVEHRPSDGVPPTGDTRVGSVAVPHAGPGRDMVTVPVPLQPSEETVAGPSSGLSSTSGTKAEDDEQPDAPIAQPAETMERSPVTRDESTTDRPGTDPIAEPTDTPSRSRGVSATGGQRSDNLAGRERTSEDPAGKQEAATPDPHDTKTDAQYVTGPHGPHHVAAESVETHGSTEDDTQLLTAAAQYRYGIDVPPQPPRWAGPPPQMPPQPPRSRLGRVALFAMLVAIGLVAMRQVSGASLGFSPYVAATLTVTGGALLVGAWFGRARWLIPIGMLLSLTLAVTSAVESADITPDGGRSWRPRTVEQIESRYKVSIGSGVLDLQQVDFTDQNVTIDLKVDGANLTVMLPPDVDVTGDAKVSYSNAVLISDEVSATTETERPFSDLGLDAAPGPGTVHLNAKVHLGNLEIHR